MPEHRNDYFYSSIDKNGNIVDIDRRMVVGIDNHYADELREKIRLLENALEEWRPLMIRHGYIEPDPKTPEQLIEEQNEIINQQGDLIKKMNEQISNLSLMVGRVLNNEQPDKHGYVSGNSEKQDRVPVKSSGKNTGSKNTSTRIEKLHRESGESGDGEQAQTDE